MSVPNWAPEWPLPSVVNHAREYGEAMAAFRADEFRRGQTQHVYLDETAAQHKARWLGLEGRAFQDFVAGWLDWANRHGWT